MMEEFLIHSKIELLTKENPSLQDYKKLITSWKRFNQVRTVELVYLIISWVLFLSNFIFLIVMLFLRDPTERFLEIYIITFGACLSISLLVTGITLYGVSRRRNSLLIIKQDLLNAILVKHNKKYH